MAFVIVSEAAGDSYKLADASVSADAAMILACRLYRGNMEANASFKEAQVDNYARAYERKMILLLEMSVTHGRTTFSAGVVLL